MRASRSLPPGRAAIVAPGEGDNPPVGENKPPAPGGKILATRREAFARLFGLAGASGIGAQATGCKSEPPGPGPATTAAFGAAPGGRLRVLHRGDPVELRREGEKMLARSLLCTHQGCEVRWRADLERYRCPCHQGIFDAAGQPFSGPPVRPLGRDPGARRGGEIVVVDEPKG